MWAADALFLCGSWASCLFLQEWRFGRSSHLRSFILVPIVSLLVCHSNLGPIFHGFGDIAGFLCSWPHPYFNLILGCSRWTRSPMLWSTWAGTLGYSAMKLFSKYSNLCDDGTWTLQTDGQTTYCGITARAVIKNMIYASQAYLLARSFIALIWSEMASRSLQTTFTCHWLKKCARTNTRTSRGNDLNAVEISFCHFYRAMH